MLLSWYYQQVFISELLLDFENTLWSSAAGL